MDENSVEGMVHEWSNLPSVILYEIFTYLPLHDRLNASATCKSWRSNLFYPSFWKTVNFVNRTNEEQDKQRARFFKSAFSKKVRNAHLFFDSLDNYCLEVTTKLLLSFKGNKHLKQLMLFPSHCRLFPVPHHLFLERHVFEPLCMILEKCKEMESFSLGCLEEMVIYSNEFIQLISKLHSNSIRIIGIASLKYDPDDYIVTPLDVNFITKFSNLEILSIDFDTLDDTLLNLLRFLNLSRLIVHVHGISPFHAGTSDMSWKALKQSCPKLEVRLNVIHAYDIIQSFETTILHPSMPLSHLRVFFCEQLNMRALLALSSYSETFQSLWWVDSFDSPNTNALIVEVPVPEVGPPEMNPFIYASWRCPKLTELVIFGYKYLAEDVFAISRLRGYHLKNLQLASSDMVYTEDGPIDLDAVESEVSTWIGRDWKALQDYELHSVILRRYDGASDEFILPIVLNDLK